MAIPPKTAVRTHTQEWTAHFPILPNGLAKQLCLHREDGPSMVMGRGRSAGAMCQWHSRNNRMGMLLPSREQVRYTAWQYRMWEEEREKERANVSPS